MSNDTVFTFGGNAPHTNARQKDKTVTGGKGANLAEMASIGLPVPPRLTIATEQCLTPAPFRHLTLPTAPSRSLPVPVSPLQ